MKLVFFLFFSFLLIGCSKLPFGDEEIINMSNQTNISNQTTISSNSYSNVKEFSFGFWNMNVFGREKINNPYIIETLKKTSEKYDLLFLLEYRDLDGRGIGEVMSSLDSKNYIFSPLLGEEPFVERILSTYHPRIFEFLDRLSFPNEENSFMFSPQILYLGSGSESFVVVIVHFDANDAYEEIRSLPQVINYVKETYPFEEDFIILGSMYADCIYSEEVNLDGFNWKITGLEDTTVGRSNCAYDRVLVSDSLINNNISCVVDKFDDTYSINELDALVISNHYPIFCQMEVE